MAFFSTPGTERLYSGVTNSTASNGLIWSRNFTHSAGGSDFQVLVEMGQVADRDLGELQIGG